MHLMIGDLGTQLIGHVAAGEDVNQGRNERDHQEHHDREMIDPVAKLQEAAAIKVVRPLWVDGRKIDFIIERMIKGLNTLPRDPLILSNAVAAWYRMLSDSGIMLLDCAADMEEYIDSWVKALRRSYSSLKIEWDGDGLMIQKFPDAPQELPLLVNVDSDALTTEAREKSD